MKYAGKMVLIVLAGMFVTACTINKPAEKVRTVTVNGTGSVSVSPDSAVLSFSLPAQVLLWAVPALQVLFSGKVLLSAPH